MARGHRPSAHTERNLVGRGVFRLSQGKTWEWIQGPRMIVLGSCQFGLDRAHTKPLSSTARGEHSQHRSTTHPQDHSQAHLMGSGQYYTHPTMVVRDGGHPEIERGMDIPGKGKRT